MMRMEGRQTILGGCCTWCILYSVYTYTQWMVVLGVWLYSVYAVLGANSWSWHRDIDRDDLPLCSAMMVELWTRKREMGMMMTNDVEDTSGYEKSGVWLAWLGWEDLLSVKLHTGSVLLPAVSGMVNWLAHVKTSQVPVSHDDFPHHRSSLSVSSSTLPWPTNTKLSHRCLSLHAMIKS